jgi:hypothetical protein
VEVTAFTSQAAGRLIAVSPHLAELLAIVTLGEVIGGFVRLYPHGNMTETRQREYFLGLLVAIECN